MSFYYKLVLNSDDAMTIYDLLEQDHEQNRDRRKPRSYRTLYYTYRSAYSDAKTDAANNTKTLELEDIDVKNICEKLFDNELPELHDRLAAAANAYVDTLRTTEPSYPRHSGATISAYHLSQQTLSDFIRVKIDKDDEKRLTLPPNNLPYGFYLISDGDTTSIVNHNGSHASLDHYFHNHTCADDSFALPGDLIALLHWMYDSGYDFVALTMWEEGARGYGSQDHWDYITQTETFLPFYDLDKVNTVFVSPCNTPEKQAIYNHIDVRQMDIDTVWDDDYVPDYVSDLFPDTDFSKKATRRRFYHSSDEIYTAAKHVLDSTVYCSQARARAVFTDANALADWLDKQRYYSPKAPKLNNADRHVISLDLAKRILECVGGTAWDVKEFPLNSVPRFKTYYCEPANKADEV